jgi:hypothetical protein
MHVMHVKNVNHIVPHDHWIKLTKAKKAAYARTYNQQDLKGYYQVGTEAPPKWADP